MGLAYKKNTGDARQSPAGRVAELLVSLGAVVTAADPHVADDQVPAGVRRVPLDAGAVAEAQAVVLLTEHDAFDLSLLDGALVLDTRHVLQARVGLEHL